MPLLAPNPDAAIDRTGQETTILVELGIADRESMALGELDLLITEESLLIR